MSRRKSAFAEHGIENEINTLVERTQRIYLEDDIPWIIGYSGGKDSTATTQLVWQALSELPKEKRHKDVHIISTDTLVENPIVSLWVEKSLTTMEQAAAEQELPIIPHKLTPEIKDRFWVNLIGRGYPTPRPKFRWCTERLKISPANQFMTEMVQKNGEAILVLGTRKAESAARHASMKRHENSTREYLSKNANQQLDRAWIYAPIGEWTNDDVWGYLVAYDNPWGYDNSSLLSMYRGATEDNECPLVVDSSTPSCGDSRFGCFVCTMVEQDKSMAAMIKNDDEKQWMKPLLNFRDKWLTTKDREFRDFRRMNGQLTVYMDRLVHGPYKESYRHQLLSELLKAQTKVRTLGPEDVRELDLITIEDLEEIRRIWVIEKHEIEDSLPGIYEEATGQPYPVKNLDENQIFKPDDMALLKEICAELGDDEGIQYQLARELLHLEQQHRTMARRSGLYEMIDKALEKGAFNNKAEAEEFAVARSQAIKSIRETETNDATVVIVEAEELETA